jgi:hypothetical protein
MKTMKKISLLSILGLLLITTSCIDDFTIRGNGIESSEDRIVTDFDQLKSSGSFDVEIINGDEYSLVVYAESNIIPYIETYVTNGTLNIDIRGLHNVNNRLPMQIIVTTPQIRSIKQSGSGDIIADYFDTNEFDLSISGSGSISTSVDAAIVNARISGSGKIEISGSALFANYNISGSGRIDSYDLITKNCDAYISGSGSMYVSASDIIQATISGSGNVFYLGNPAIDTHISGSGRVISRN